MRQNVGPRLTAHQKDQHENSYWVSEPEYGIRPLVSYPRPKLGRDGARRFGESGGASSKNISNLISDTSMDEKYSRTREIFDRSPP